MMGVFLVFALCMDKGHYFPEHIIIPLVVTDGFVPGFHLIVHPAFRIDAVDRKHFYFPGINKWPHGIY